MNRVSTLALASGLAMAWVSPALAQNADESDTFYVAAGLTGSFLDDMDTTVANGNNIIGNTIKIETSVESGLGGYIAIGRTIGMARVELELGQTQNDPDSYSVISPFKATLPQSGKNDITRWMANAYLDFGHGRIRPYVGAGMGGARLHAVAIAAIAAAPNSPPTKLVDDKMTSFAYQVMAGASFRLSKNWAVNAQYRWFDAGTFEGVDARDQRYTREGHGHNVDIGVRFNF